MVPLAHAISEHRLKLIANEEWTGKTTSLMWKWNTLWKDQVSFPLRKKFVFSSSRSWFPNGARFHRCRAWY